MYYHIFVPAHVIKVWPYLEGKKGDLGVAKIPRMTKATILSHVIFFPLLYTQRKGVEWIHSPWAKTNIHKQCQHQGSCASEKTWARSKVGQTFNYFLGTIIPLN